MLDQQSADYLLNKIQGYTWADGLQFSFADIDGKILVSTGDYEEGDIALPAIRMIKEYNGSHFHSPDILRSDSEENSIWALITLRGFAIGAFEAKGVRVNEKGIREMSEIVNILTAGYCRENMEERNQNALKDFFEEWLIGRKAYRRSTIEKAEYDYYRTRDNREDENFVLRGKILGIDITIPRRVVVLKMLNIATEEGEHLSVEAKRRLRYRLEGYLSHNSNNLCVIFGDYIVLMMPGTEEEVYYSINRVRSNLEMMYECKVSGGFSEQYTHWKDAGERFNEAKIACDTAQLADEKRMMQYDARSVLQMLNMIPTDMRKEFFRGIFDGCEDKEIEEYMETLRVFFESDLSISRAAEKMYVHKNTLKYRLGRMKDKVGLDPRDQKDSLILYFLMLLKRLEGVS